MLASPQEERWVCDEVERMCLKRRLGQRTLLRTGGHEQRREQLKGLFRLYEAIVLNEQGLRATVLYDDGLKLRASSSADVQRSTLTCGEIQTMLEAGARGCGSVSTMRTASAIHYTDIP